MRLPPYFFGGRAFTSSFSAGLQGTCSMFFGGFGCLRLACACVSSWCMEGVGEDFARRDSIAYVPQTCGKVGSQGPSPWPVCMCFEYIRLPKRRVYVVARIPLTGKTTSGVGGGIHCTTCCCKFFGGITPFNFVGINFPLHHTYITPFFVGINFPLHHIYITIYLFKINCVMFLSTMVQTRWHGMHHHDVA